MSQTISAYDLDIMTKTVYGEARGEIEAGQVAVAYVILNRALIGADHPHFGNGSVSSACLAPWQFSSWNAGDPNRTKLEGLSETDAEYVALQEVCQSVIDGVVDDPTDGATFYYAKSMNSPPTWSNGHVPCADIGNHLFFKGIA